MTLTAGRGKVSNAFRDVDKGVEPMDPKIDQSMLGYYYTVLLLPRLKP